MTDVTGDGLVRPLGGIVNTGGMDLAYTPEAEAFRIEIRDWLASNLPDGLG